ncbi:MAG: flagellar motor protein MotB [Hyphomicrobiaceae bacterium]|nr:flagellar motor protein MotB [Hyphomicrobiaceae bacterium]
MAKKKGDHGGGGHGGAWVITFADLVSLLMAFFVMLLSFSVQDEQKIATVAGSMKDAFGVQPEQRKASLIEINGLPVRSYYKEVGVNEDMKESEIGQTRKEDHAKSGSELSTHDIEKAERERKRQFASAATTLRQSWADRPDIAELSKDIQMQITPEGLEISLIDQDGHAMFDDGSPRPVPSTQKLLAALAPVLRGLPHQVRITGHTSARAETNAAGARQSIWWLSSARADAVRSLLTANGLSDERIDSVVGKGSTDPIFPNDPYLSGNRRVEITLLNAAPPLPTTFQP